MNTKHMLMVENNRSTAPFKEDLLHVLGLSSDEDIYNAQYNGQSLADIANANKVDVQKVIELQLTELTEQLNARLQRYVIIGALSGAFSMLNDLL